MEFDKLLARHEALLTATLRTIGSGSDPAAITSQSTALTDSEKARISGRIAALEAEKSNLTSRIDAEIDALKHELATPDDAPTSDPALIA